MGVEVFAKNDHYLSLLRDIKKELKQARLRASLAVNKELIQTYWFIGQRILQQQQQAKWGDHFLAILSKDLQQAFPGTKGFSVPSLKRMRLFAQTYSHFSDLSSQPVSQLPWGHIAVLLYKIKDEAQREWYARQALEQGWSRFSLENAISRSLYQQSTGKKVSNYLMRLPEPQSMLAQEILKSPYQFNFLGVGEEAEEREIEHALIKHIPKALLELGKGFAFVGRQVPIVLSEEEYFIDLLFYHLKLHAYVVVELKATKFKPEHAGKLNFYLNLVDDYYKIPQDNPSIGLLLCKSRDHFVAEYALKGIEKPIGISEYELTKILPEPLKASLPSIDEIEAQLNALEENSEEAK